MSKKILDHSSVKRNYRFLAILLTCMVAGALVGWTGQASSYGVWFIFAGCAVTIATYICWRLLSGKVMRLSKKLDLLTVPDFLEARFESRTARLIAGLILLIFTVPLMVSQFKAAGLLLNMVTGIDYKAAVILFGVIVFVYVAFGGYFAVVYTDAVQGGLMLFGIAALVITALIAVGGNLGEAYAAANPIGAVSWPTTGSALTSTAFIAVLMNNFFGALGAPNYIKGFYSLKGPKEQKRGFTMIMSIVCVIEVCIIVIGLCGKVLFPDLASPDQTVFMMIDSLLPPVLGGLVLALGLASGSVAAYVGRLYRAEISWPVLLGTALGMSLLLRLVFGQAARHGGNEIMSITISLGGKCCTVRALHDTGCTLRDPVTGGPVLVLERRALDPLWTPPVRDILAQPLPPEEKMARLHGEGSGRRFTLLPFTAVGTASGLLLAVYSDYIELAGRRHRRALLALSDGPLSDGGGYQALWGGEEGRSREKSAAAAAALDQSAQQAG